ncbi:CYTH domain-containing protein, partial [Candidatus Parcubacteria bacterium]|nr:CYTH domain-containing protein [Patescibacteria group bacterium]MCG2698414.1 CYTH domain-containing protein [Candidatus Parcubacteria bacterium]
MDIEYEATFENINKDEMRKKLEEAGAKLIRPEFLQKRVVFYLPNKQRHAWLRVRDEGDKNTMSLKIIDGGKIQDQKEICLNIDNFARAVEFLTAIGCEKKSYQETKRELWKLDGVEITIDEWPFLEPLVEVEGKSEQDVKKVCAKIGLNYNKALFCAIGELYKRKYGVSLEYINNQVPLLT